MASKVKYIFNLKEEVKKTFDSKGKEYIARAYSRLNQPDVKKLIGEMIIEKIYERTTKDNIDKNGKSFPKYSKTYKGSFIYKVYGKSSDVNLLLTGDMLSDMKAQSQDSNIVISFDTQEQNDKAHGHINGIKTKKGKVKRDFLGLQEKEKKAILKDAIKTTNVDIEINKIINRKADIIKSELSEKVNIEDLEDEL